MALHIEYHIYADPSPASCPFSLSTWFELVRDNAVGRTIELRLLRRVFLLSWVCPIATRVWRMRQGD